MFFLPAYLHHGPTEMSEPYLLTITQWISTKLTLGRSAATVGTRASNCAIPAF